MAVCPTPSFQRERRHATKINGSKDRSDGLWPPPDVLEVENSSEIRGLLCCTSSCLSLRKLKGKFRKFRIWKLEWHKESQKWELCLIWPRPDSASLSRPLSWHFLPGGKHSLYILVIFKTHLQWILNPHMLICAIIPTFIQKSSRELKAVVLMSHLNTCNVKCPFFCYHLAMLCVIAFPP